MAIAAPAAVAGTVTVTVPVIHSVAPAAAPITGFVTIWGFSINPSAIVLSLAAVSLIYMLWQGQRDRGRNSFDVWDLIMDTLPNGRRASGIKFAYQIAFILSSWVIVDNEIKGTLTEAIFGLYLGTWCASLIAKVVFDKQEPIKLPGAGDHRDGDSPDGGTKC